MRWLCVVPFVALSCHPPATALRVQVDADPALAGYVQMVRIRVYSPPYASRPVEQRDVVVGLGNLRWPVAFNVVGASGSRVRIDVDGFREPSNDIDARGIVRSRAITSFRDEKVLVLPMVFWGACRGDRPVDCSLDQTCDREGRCGGAEIASESLPEFQPQTATPRCGTGTHPVVDACVPDMTPDAAPDAAPDAVIDEPDPTPMEASVDARADASAESDAVDVTDVSDAADVIADEAPRPVAPLSGSKVTRGDIALTWLRHPAALQSELRVCRDRNCTMVEFSTRTGGESFSVPVALSAGAHWWQVSHVRPAGVTSAWSTPWLFTTPARSAAVATVTGTSPDYNADGIGDLAVGEPSGPVAQVRLYLGRVGPLDFSRPSVVIPGPRSPFGERIANVGDFNGDGYPDLAVAMTGDGPDAQVAIFAGAASGINSAPFAQLRPDVSPSGTRFAESLAGVGDLDRDGYADVIVGSMAENSNSGVVRVYYGAPFSSLVRMVTLPSPRGGQFGAAVTALGDFNADGFADFAVGAPFANLGMVYVYRGAPARTPGSPLLSLESPDGPGTGFGSYLGGGLDLDGDGLGDLVAGAPVIAGQGRAYLYNGRTSPLAGSPGVTFAPSTAGAYFGSEIVSAGDLDRDGADEVIIGHAGAARIEVFGLRPAPTSVLSLERPSGAMPLASGYGKTVAAMDLNGDSRADIAVSARHDEADAGRVYVHVQGPSGVASTPTLVLTSDAGAQLGASLAR